jgi:NAD(P)-dependent dehydrogenase (short-subunit alcohol dehydrogenase family)
MTAQQTVIVTGALTGIGRATAAAFARNGDRVAIAGRHAQAGADLATELRHVGVEVEFVKTDVRFEGEIEQLVDHKVARFG